MPSPKRKLLGKYIVADPRICHGKPTFIGTRIMAWQILRQVEKGKSWDAIVSDWRGSVSMEAIAESVALRQQILEYTDENGNSRPKGP